MEVKAGFETGGTQPTVLVVANSRSGRSVRRVQSPDDRALRAPRRAPEGWLHRTRVLHPRNPEPMLCRDMAWVHREPSMRPSSSALRELHNQFGLVVTEARTLRALRMADFNADSFRQYVRNPSFGVRPAPRPDIVLDYQNLILARNFAGRPVRFLCGMLELAREPRRFSRRERVVGAECGLHSQAADARCAGPGGRSGHGCYVLMSRDPRSEGP